MTTVTVSPEEFTLVFFEAEHIASKAGEIAHRVGLDADIRIEVDEASPLSRIRVRSVDPVELWAQGGAFEDPKRPRYISERNLAEALGRLILRARDRRDPAFGEVPADDDLTLQQHNVWDTYCLGRLERAGYEVAKARWLYHFRTRQGFTDVADATFERLWQADGLTWADLEEARLEAEQARAAA